MERALRLPLLMAAFSFSAPLFAHLTIFDVDVKPSLGFDVGTYSQPFEAGFGEEQFRKHYPDTQIYAAVKFFEYFGLEAGYEHMYSLGT